MKNLLYLSIATFIISCNASINSKTDLDVNQKVTFTDTIPKITGIGGIFFRSTNPKEMMAWYKTNFGMAMDDYGSPFEFRNANRPEEINYLRWHPQSESSDYFEPSKKEFMINYRVQNIEGLVKKLEGNGITFLDSITTFEYGKFIHLIDIDGNKIELWEPKDSFFTEMGGETTK